MINLSVGDDSEESGMSDTDRTVTVSDRRDHRRTVNIDKKID